MCWHHTILNPAQRWDVVWNGGAVRVLWWGGQGTHIIIVAAIASKCSLLWFILWRVMCALCRFEWISLQMHADRLTAFICNRAFSAYEGDVGLEGVGDSVDEVFGKCVHTLSQCWHATKYNFGDYPFDASRLAVQQVLGRWFLKHIYMESFCVCIMFTICASLHIRCGWHLFRCWSIGGRSGAYQKR